MVLVREGWVGLWSGRCGLGVWVIGGSGGGGFDMWLISIVCWLELCETRPRMGYCAG